MQKTDTNYDRDAIMTVTEFATTTKRPHLQVKTAIKEASLKAVGKVHTGGVGKPPLVYDRLALQEAVMALDAKRQTARESRKNKANVEQTDIESDVTNDNDLDIFSEKPDTGTGG